MFAYFLDDCSYVQISMNIGIPFVSIRVSDFSQYGNRTETLKLHFSISSKGISLFISSFSNNLDSADKSDIGRYEAGYCGGFLNLRINHYTDFFPFFRDVSYSQDGIDIIVIIIIPFLIFL